MRFWDASALVPLYVQQSRSRDVQRLYGGDQSVTVWWGSRPECIAALMRLIREGWLTAADEPAVRARLTRLLAVANEVAPAEDVRERAERLLAVHALRAADALQLGAALIWARERPARLGFVSLD